MSVIADMLMVLIKACRMLPGWKRVAKCGDNIAFAPEEIGKAIVHAPKQDCNLSDKPTS
jgi:hypothetical protein